MRSITLPRLKTNQTKIHAKLISHLFCLLIFRVLSNISDIKKAQLLEL